MIAGVNEILSEDSGVQALIGQNEAGDKYKIYPVVAPFGEQHPYLTTSRTSTAPVLHKGTGSTLDTPGFAVHVHSKSYDSIDEISEAVREALDQKASVTEAGYVFDRIWYVNEYDRPELFTADHPVYVRTIIFNCQVRRT